MRIPTKIFLIGPMGAGKSTIGKQLAASLKLSFNDSDSEIQRRTGVDIPTIFEFEGEEGFRKREAIAINDMTQGDYQVLATGGGTVMHAENCRYLTSRGFVIYLQCSINQQYERTSRDKTRPLLLDTDDQKGKLKTLMKIREPLYREAADMIVSTEQRGAASVVKEIIERIETL